MRPPLRHPPPPQQQHLIRVSRRRQPVRHHNRDPARTRLPQRSQHLRLAARVQRARRLVEQQDRRLLGQRPRERKPLPLPAAEGGALPAAAGREAIGEREDEVEDVRLPRGGLEEGVVRGGEGRGGRGGVRHAEQDVVGQGAVEQMCVLGHEGNA